MSSHNARGLAWKELSISSWRIGHGPMEQLARSILNSWATWARISKNVSKMKYTQFDFDLSGKAHKNTPRNLEDFSFHTVPILWISDWSNEPLSDNDSYLHHFACTGEVWEPAPSFTGFNYPGLLAVQGTNRSDLQKKNYTSIDTR